MIFSPRPRRGLPPPGLGPGGGSFYWGLPRTRRTLERRRFFDKIWDESNVLFRQLTFFFKYGHESSQFFMQNRKKGHHFDFFGPEYTLVLTDLTLSLTKCGREGGFHVIFEKNLVRLRF